MSKPKSKATESNGRTTLWLKLIIAFTAFALYSNTLNHGYVLDDVSVISGNRHVMQGVDGIKPIWTTSYRDGYWNDSGTLYRPLTLSVFAVQWYLSPGNPALGHWTNVLMYVLLCLMIFKVINQLTAHRNWAFFSALIFAAITMHTEVVANIKSLDELLSMTLGVGAWLAVLKWFDTNHFKYLSYSALVFLAGMFTKEGLIAYVLIIPLSLVFFRNAQWKTLIKPAISLLIPVGVYLSFRAVILGGITASLTPSSIDNPMVNYTFLERWFTGIKLLGLYVKKLFTPNPLAYEYAFNTLEKASLSDHDTWIGIIATLALIYFLIKGFKSRKWWAFASAYFLITIALYTNTLILIGAMFAERFVFFASLAWAMAIGGFLINIKTKHFQLASLVAIVLLYGGLSYARNPVWESSYSLYAADINALDNSCKAHYNLGLEIMKEQAMKTQNTQERKRLLNRAMKEFEKSLRIKPGYNLPKGQIALVHYRLGNYSEAIERYQEVLDRNPNDDSGWNNLAGALVATNQYEGALECYKKAIAINPYYTDALGNCGAVNGMLGRHEEAIKYLERAVEMAPNNASYYQYLGLSHKALGNTATANNYFVKAKQLGFQ